MNKCLFCYKAIELDLVVDYHPSCSKKFFGKTLPPILPYNFNEMEQLAKDAVEQSIAVPGVQPKLSLDFITSEITNKHSGRLTILNALDGYYILKPPNMQYEQMPENEHLTMRLAELFKIKVVPSALIRLASNELCYITKRIDRSNNGLKIHMIDFLQILELEHKYLGTMEQLGKAIGNLSVHTLMDKLNFFELAIFNFIVGNNDMHLKNFSMFLSINGWVLSPAYDLLNVKIVLPKDTDETALLLGGKKKNFNKAYFDKFATILLLNTKQTNVVYSKIKKWVPNAIHLINLSFLEEHLKASYKSLVLERSALLSIN
jgi:serine/threonine-protein kinase HipA